jgi:hypothetical protein
MLLHNPEPHADPDDEPQTTLDRSPFFIETNRRSRCGPWLVIGFGQGVGAVFAAVLPEPAMPHTSYEGEYG